SSDLSHGSKGSDVSSLQQFLVSQNYPGTGSWMVTGYYGRATEAAVRNFQAGSGLIQSGVVDRATRNAIRERSCGNYGYLGGVSGSQYPYQYAYQYPSQYPYTYPGYQYGYTIPLRLDSLSVTSGSAGTSLTLYGSGFEATYNTVRFGSNVAYGAGSTNGTSLTLTVPGMPPGVYPVTVTNGRGTSNSLSFTVIGSPYSYYNYGYNYGNYNYGYSYPYMNTYNYGCGSYMYPYGCN
ncbi:hypothetical protein C4556_00290, partial [Candidatus Parcubacteria bacterium]